MTKEAKKVFDKFFKIHRDNVAGKTICFISRGEWSEPQIAYKGYLLNYWDVLELACPEDAPKITSQMKQNGMTLVWILYSATQIAA